MALKCTVFHPAIFVSRMDMLSGCLTVSEKIQLRFPPMSDVNITSVKNHSQSSSRRSGFKQRFGSSRSSTMTSDGRFSSTSAPRGDWFRPSGRSVMPFAVSHSTVFHTGPRRTPKSRTILGLSISPLMLRRIFFAMGWLRLMMRINFSSGTPSASWKALKQIRQSGYQTAQQVVFAEPRGAWTLTFTPVVS